MTIPIRLNAGKIRTDFEEVLMPVQSVPSFKWLTQFEEELLRFADRFKTRRVYCAEFTVDRSPDGIFRLDSYCKFFTFDDRSIAYNLARHHHGHVQIYNFANLINHSLEWVERVPSPNRDQAIELWKTFNTCDICHAEAKCVDAQVYRKLGRVCESCIDKYCIVDYPNKTVPFKEGLIRHFKAVKDTTCNCLFCRNLNKQSTPQLNRSIEQRLIK